MAGVNGYKSTEYQWDDTVYAGKGGTVTLEPGDMLGMGKSHWCMVGSAKELADSVEIWIIHGNHDDRRVWDETRHYNKKTGKATDMEDDDHDYFRAIYKIDFSGINTRTVTLDAGEGTCSVKSRIYSEGAYYGCLPDATREDYVFDGWYTEPDGKGKKAYPYRNLGDDVTTLYANYIHDPEAVKGVVLDRESVKLQLGKQLTLKATVEPSNAKNKTVNWSSGNSGVVSVKDGVIRGLEEGTATIMARTAGGPYVAYCEVEVVTEGGEGEDPEEEKKDDETADTGIALAVGQKVDLSAEGFFGTAFNKNDKFTVSPKKKGTVSKKGIFTAKKACGEVTVTRKVKQDGKYVEAAKITFAIEKPGYFKNSKNKNKTSVKITDRGAVVRPEDWIDMKDAHIKPDFYSCNDKKNVVEFDAASGSAVIKKSGTVKVTAYYGSVAGQAKKSAAKQVFTIKASIPAVKNIKVSAGGTVTAAVKKVPGSMTLTSESWKIVQVDEDGKPKPDIPANVFTIAPLESKNYRSCEVTAAGGIAAGTKAAIVVTVNGVDYWGIVTVK